MINSFLLLFSNSFSIPVNSPELDICGCFDCCSSGSPIDQRQLSEAASLANIENFLSVDINFNFSLQVKTSKLLTRSIFRKNLINDVKVVSFVSLSDDDLSGNARVGKHSVKNIRSFIFVQMAEEDILGNCLGQRGHGFVVLGDDFLDVGGSILFVDRFSRDGSSPPHRLDNVGGQRRLNILRVLGGQQCSLGFLHCLLQHIILGIMQVRSILLDHTTSFLNKRSMTAKDRIDGRNEMGFVCQRISAHVQPLLCKDQRVKNIKDSSAENIFWNFLKK